VASSGSNLVRYILGKLDLEINQKGHLAALNQQIMSLRSGTRKGRISIANGPSAQELKEEEIFPKDDGREEALPDRTDYPSISVIVPSFNQGQYLEETILSIIGQEYPKLELLVIDGGSTDNSVEILRRYASHIAYWHSRKDEGQGDAINQGINMSSGEVVCWLNSDDMFLPGTLLDIGRRFVGRTDACHLVYGATIELQHGADALYCQGVLSEPFDADRLTYWDFIVQPSAFWTRKLWKDVGGIDIRYTYVLDWDWFIRASRAADFEYVPRFYSIYRLHPLHKTHQGGRARREEVVDVVRRYSSNYWIKLYEQLHQSYDLMADPESNVSPEETPKRRSVLSRFSPQIASLLEDPEHLWMALNMLGMHVSE
jgi:glycosyltransferase involved in cell wall biosynthesis